jgi:pimeloyl-ACP methyl ester carboxylesterase
MPTPTFIDHELQQIRLKSGCLLGYAEYGYPFGKPVLFFHGQWASRRQARTLDKSAAECHVRLIGVDRPGFGISSFVRGRTVLDWPRDVSEFADQLGLNRFAVLGVSAGAKYALACARTLGDRISGTALVSAFGPLQNFADLLCTPPALLPWILSLQTTPGLTAPLMGWLDYANALDPDLFLTWFALMLPPADRVALGQPDTWRIMRAMVSDAFCNGSRGVAWEHRLTAAPWGFAVHDVLSQVQLWHGLEDTVVPAAMTQSLEDELQNCNSYYIKGEGHLSLLANRGRDIIRALVNGGTQNRSYPPQWGRRSLPSA